MLRERVEYFATTSDHHPLFGFSACLGKVWRTIGRHARALRLKEAVKGATVSHADRTVLSQTGATVSYVDGGDCRTCGRRCTLALSQKRALSVHGAASTIGKWVVGGCLPAEWSATRVSSSQCGGGTECVVGFESFARTTSVRRRRAPNNRQRQIFQGVVHANRILELSGNKRSSCTRLRRQGEAKKTSIGVSKPSRGNASPSRGNASPTSRRFKVGAGTQITAKLETSSPNATAVKRRIQKQSLSQHYRNKQQHNNHTLRYV